jgi:hypothetical protein
MPSAKKKSVYSALEEYNAKKPCLKWRLKHNAIYPVFSVLSNNKTPHIQAASDTTARRRIRSL